MQSLLRWFFRQDKKEQKRLAGIGIVAILLIAGVLSTTYFVQKRTQDSRSRASETTDKRWSASAYEQYKLDSKSVQQVVSEEQNYLKRLNAVETLEEIEKLPLDARKGISIPEQDLKEIGIKTTDIETAVGESPKQNAPDVMKNSKDSMLRNDEVKKATVDSVLGAQSDVLMSPQIGKRDVPSVAGGNVNQYTGTVQHSYPIQVPPIRGNASFGVSLSYNSRSIDDMRLNKLGYSDVHPDFYNGRRCEPLDQYGRPLDPASCKTYWDEMIYQNSVGTVGLGWNLSSFGSVTMDTEYENEYVLSISGQSVRIKEENGTFYTYPSSKFLLERYGPWGAWKVTDTSGNVYFFGSIDQEFADQVKDKSVNNGTPIPVNSANEYMAGWRYGDDDNRTPYCFRDKVSKWNLSRISDVHGNTIEIEYSQDTYQIVGGCYQSGSIRPVEVKYNFNEEEERYISKVQFHYEDIDVGNPWTKFKESNPGHWTTSLYSVPYSNTKILKRIDTLNDSVLINSYEFAYTKSFKNANWKFDCPYHESKDLKEYCYSTERGNGDKVRQLLLTSITKKGFDGRGNQKPITFCYQSLKDANNPQVCSGTNTDTEIGNYTPNDIYLVSFNNGYGGEVRYSYERVANVDRVCGPENNIPYAADKNFQKRCFTPGSATRFGGNSATYLASHYRIRAVTASNGLGQEKMTDYLYKGNSVAYVSNYGRNYIGNLPSNILGLNGVQYLGYPEVQIRVTDKNNPGKVLSNIQNKTFPLIETDSCVMVDPRSGSEFRSEVLNENNALIGYTDTEIFARQGLDCRPDPKTWGEIEVYSRQIVSELDGKKARQKTVYDFEIYGDAPGVYGNPVISANYGNPDVQGDEVYSYNLYLTPDRLAFFQKEGLVPQDLTYEQYRVKNLISLSVGSFTTAEEFSKPEDVPQNKRLNFTRNLYDTNLSAWGYQVGVGGVRGLLSRTQTIYTGTSADSPTAVQTLDAYQAFNKYGLVTKRAMADKQKSYVFYEKKLHLIPVCSTSVSSQFVSEFDNQSQERLCDVNQDKGKKMTQRLIFENDESLLKQLPSYSEDTNGARTAYKYDEYGRVTEVFAPNPNKPFETLGFASSKAFYYDDQSPMRTRIQSTGLLADNLTRVTKTADTFMDGFGNEYQSIAYNNLDKDGEYALVSFQEYNGIGQVTRKVGGVPVRDLKPQDNPQIYDKNALNLSLGSIEETTYDYFSRPTQVRVTSGGENGAPITKTVQTSFGGYEVNIIDAVGNQLIRVMDGLGREIKTTNYLCPSDSNCKRGAGRELAMTMTYDVLGNVLTVTDTNGIVIKKNTYNTASMPLQSTDSDRGISKIFYDGAGRPHLTVDAKGTASQVEFDGFGRPLKTQIKTSKGVLARETVNIYDGDKVGLIDKTTLHGLLPNGKWNLIQEISTKYNFVGTPLEVTSKTVKASSINTNPQYITKVDTSSFNDTGLVVRAQSKLDGSREDLDSTSFDYKRDLSLNTLKDNTTNKLLVKDIVSDFKGQVLGYELAEKILVKQTFDNESKLLNKSTARSSTGFDPPLIDDLRYTYNNAGNIVSFTSQDRTESKTYAYDSLSRLTRVDGQYTGEYRISEVGALNYKKEGTNTSETVFVSDLLKSNPNPCREISGYNEKVNGCPYHAALRSTINGNQVSYLYDKNGNLVREINADGSYREHTYEVLDLPAKIIDYKSAKQPKSTTIFVYGIGGQRVGKVSDVGTSVTPTVNPTKATTPTNTSIPTPTIAATHNLKGKVQYSGGTGIANVLIEVYQYSASYQRSLRTSVRTNSSGSYTVPNVPNGTYDIVPKATSTYTFPTGQSTVIVNQQSAKDVTVSTFVAQASQTSTTPTKAPTRIPQATMTPTRTPTAAPPSGQVRITSNNTRTGVIAFSASWSDTRGGRKVFLGKCVGAKGKECRTVQKLFTCPTQYAPQGSIATASGSWCSFAVSGKSLSWNFSTVSSNISSGRYVLGVNNTIPIVGNCTGNPVCTINGGPTNCGAWVSCHTNSDYVEFVVTKPDVSPQKTKPTIVLTPQNKVTSPKGLSR